MGLIQRFKKTGEYGPQTKIDVQSFPSYPMKAGTTKPTETKPRKCPLGLIFLDDQRIKIVSSKIYSETEEKILLELHQYFLENGIV